MKICSYCKCILPATLKYFYQKSTKNSGLRSWCRKCTAIKTRSYQRTEAAKVKARKRCARYSKTIKGHLRSVFANMKQRCENPANARYTRYGGRGIEVHSTANEFVSYVIDELRVDPRGLQCDRIDNDGNYERGNIRFVTHKENCNNK